MLFSCFLLHLNKQSAFPGMKIPETIPVKRITLRSIGAEVLAQLNLEKGLGYTVKQLIVAPGQVIQEYLFEDRSRVTKPLTLVLLVVTVTAFISLRFFPTDGSLEKALSKGEIPETIMPAVTLMVTFTRQFFNLVLMSSLPALALGSYLMFREKRLNYAEHLIINMYIFAIQTIAQLLFLPFLDKLPWLGLGAGALSIGYFLYALVRIFDISWVEAVWKSVVIYIIAQFIQMIVFGIVFLFFWIFA